MPVTVTHPRSLTIVIRTTRVIHTITAIHTVIHMVTRMATRTVISTATITERHQGNTSPVWAKNMPLCLRSY